MEVPLAIRKAIVQAKKHTVSIPIYETSLPHEVMFKYKSAKILLKPAPLGTGLKVGSVVRTILELGGIENASGKIIGTRNQAMNAYAVIESIKTLQDKKKTYAIE